MFVLSNWSNEYFPYIESSGCKNIKNVFGGYHSLIYNLVQYYLDHIQIEKLVELTTVLSLSVKLEYLDIFNTVYTNTFEVSVDFVVMNKNKVTFYIKLDNK